MYPSCTDALAPSILKIEGECHEEYRLLGQTNLSMNSTSVSYWLWDYGKIYITSSSSSVKRNDIWFMDMKMPTMIFDTK